MPYVLVLNKDVQLDKGTAACSMLSLQNQREQPQQMLLQSRMEATDLQPCMARKDYLLLQSACNHQTESDCMIESR